MQKQDGGEELLAQLDELAELIRKHIVSPMYKSQLVAKARWEASDEDQNDNFLFGIDSWHLMKNHIFRAVDKSDPEDFPFEKKSTHGLVHDSIEIRWHRVGGKPPENMDLNTPKSSCRAARLVAKQLDLFRKGKEEPNESEPSGNTVILAYTSEPDTGLTGVYLATIGNIDEEKSLILNWKEKTTVWERDETIQEPTTEAAATTAPIFDIASRMTFDEEPAAPREFHVEEVMTTSSTENPQDESESS